MTNAIGIIYANGTSDNLQGLALKRPLAAVPFGGRYRIIDFALSSMVNSGLKTIGVVIPHRYRPILDHLGAGKDWFLDRKDGGLFILPGETHGLSENEHKFCIEDLRNNIEYLQKESAENVIISSGDQIYNVNFKNMLEFHNDKHADVTLIYKEYDNRLEPHDERFLEIGADQKVTRIKDTKDIKGQKNSESADPSALYFANMFIIRREILLDIAERCVGCSDIIDLLASNLNVLKTYGCPTYAMIGMIRNHKDYFDRSMELLDLEVREKLLLGTDQIHTRIKDNPPTQYSSHAIVSNSLIASGCSIAGEVMNSIIFRGVIIEQGCHINNSIILPECHIHANAQTNNAILDKSVKVNEENVLSGSLHNPLVILKS